MGALSRCSIFLMGVSVALGLAGLALVGSKPLNAASPSDVLQPSSARSISQTRLIVFEMRNCRYCDVVRQRIKPLYDKSLMSRTWPMQFEDAEKSADGGVKLDRPISVLPTIVIVRDGREINRIQGFPGRQAFFKIMSRIVIKDVPEAR